MVGGGPPPVSRYARWKNGKLKTARHTDTMEPSSGAGGHVAKLQARRGAVERGGANIAGPRTDADRMMG